MSKKKKKAKPNSQEKEFERFHLEHKKAVHWFLIRIGLKEGIFEFPEEYIEKITKRGNLPLVFPSEPDNIPPKMLAVANQLLKHFLQADQVESFPGGPSFPLAFYFTTEALFCNLIEKMDEEDFPGLPSVLERTKAYWDNYEKKHNEVFQRLGTIINAISYTLVQETNEIYYIMQQLGKPNFEMVNNDRNKLRLLNYILHRQEREEKEIVVDNESRMAMRMTFGFGNVGAKDLLIKAETLGIESPFGSMELPVYIQNHALKRMNERLGQLYITDAMLEICFALQAAKFVVVKKGHALLEFKLSNCKVGYFKIVLTEGVLLIQTFLFLTNNGTPEGDKLNELLGMQKADKKYWEIDKLTTFLASDIEENETLKQIFINAGCKSLFDYKRAPKLSDKDKQQQLQIGLASMLAGFVQKTQEAKQNDKFEE